MPKLGSEPLTDADYKNLNEQLTKLAAVRQDIDRAKRAGFPCEEQEGMCQYCAEFLERIKREYFSDRP